MASYLRGGRGDFRRGGGERCYRPYQNQQRNSGGVRNAPSRPFRQAFDFSSRRFLNPYNVLSRPTNMSSVPPPIMVDLRYNQRAAAPVPPKTPTQPQNAVASSPHSLRFGGTDAIRAQIPESVGPPMFIPVQNSLEACQLILASQEMPYRSDSSNDGSGRGQAAYACQACNKRYVLFRTYRDHMSTHVQCSKENCSFQASPHLVVQHYTSCHLRKFASGRSEQWINERKRNFPVAPGPADLKVSRVDGAVNLDDARTESKLSTCNSDKVNSTLACNDGRREQEFTNDQYVDCQSVAVQSPNFSAAGKASEEPKQSHSQSEKDPTSDDDMPEKLKKLLAEADLIGQQVQQRKRTTLFPSVVRHGKTLLEKLLQDEIRHERSVLLQCIQYIVQTDFLREKTPLG